MTKLNTVFAIAITALFPLPSLSSNEAAQHVVMSLSMKRAVELALSPEGNVRIQLADEAVKQSESQAAQSRAALLPQVNGLVTGESVTRNLATFGFSEAAIEGFRLPNLLGPFVLFDARLAVSQNVIDLSSIRRFQAAKSNIRTARSEGAATANQVTAQVAKAYLEALRAESGVEAAKANVALARAVQSRAEAMSSAGNGATIEVTRAKVQVSDALQRLLAAGNERRRAHLELAHAVGLRLDTEIVLTDVLQYLPVDETTLEQASALALQHREDWNAQQDREQTAELATRAVGMERLPTLTSFADYGTTGTGFNSSIPTRSVGVSLRIPVFDGGRREALRAEAGAQLRQERIRSHDLEERMVLESSLALDSLRSADEQLKVAEESLALAERELERVRQRHDAGLTDAVELTEAQTLLERARNSRVNALFQYNQARLELGEATGTIRQMIH